MGVVSNAAITVAIADYLAAATALVACRERAAPHVRHPPMIDGLESPKTGCGVP